MDDSDKIQALAEVIAKSLLLTRVSCGWTSQRHISAVQVGDLIASASGRAVVSPITSVHMKADVGNGSPAPNPTQSFETYRGQLDPLRAIKQLGGNVEDFEIQHPQDRKRPKRLSLAERRRAKAGANS